MWEVIYGSAKKNLGGNLTNMGYKQNLTIEEIARKRNLTTGTIASHIEKLIVSGEEIDIDELVDIDKQ